MCIAWNQSTSQQNTVSHSMWVTVFLYIYIKGHRIACVQKHCSVCTHTTVCYCAGGVDPPLRSVSPPEAFWEWIIMLRYHVSGIVLKRSQTQLFQELVNALLFLSLFAGTSLTRTDSTTEVCVRDLCLIIHMGYCDTGCCTIK